MDLSCTVCFAEAEGSAGEAAEPEATPGRSLVPEPQSQVVIHRLITINVMIIQYWLTNR
jgi:hypothetical protein